MTANPENQLLDKFLGCLIGGGVGDALGYEVEFEDEEDIFRQFAPDGIREYVLHNGVAPISDDTQMTMFTANALLGETARSYKENRKPNYVSAISDAYREWYKTQRGGHVPGKSGNRCWIMNIARLYACRAPGITCLNAISQGCWGSPEDPINSSKGCGGVMRVAPIGLLRADMDMDTLDRLGASAAALTHGHELGYIPGAMLVHIVRMAAFSEGDSLKQIVLDARNAMARLYADCTHTEDFLRLVDKAVALSESSMPDLTAVHALGKGWVGDEALAIAIYCALKHCDDFENAMFAAVNHSGDSDSTGAIAGNILGTWLGLSGIPEKYVKDLELKSELMELAEDLFDFRQEDPIWESKYITAGYPLVWQGKTPKD